MPDEAIICTVRFGEITLRDCAVEPECLPLIDRRPILVSTAWSIEQPIAQHYSVSLRAEPVRECNMLPWTTEPFRLPVEHWMPQKIYYQRFELMPSSEGNMLNIDLRLTFEVFVDGESIETFSTPPVIEPHFPKAAFIKKIYPSSVFQSPLDRLWTARQIVDVTDGEWIVPPPEDWFVRSVAYRLRDLVSLSAPCLFSPMTNFWSSPDRPQKLSPKIAAIVVSKRREDVPADLPQLLTPNPSRVVVELGIANRRRYKGRVIAVTGSSGKSTTCAMLNHVLSDTLKVFKTYQNQNITLVPVVFASVPTNAAFAIIEMASSAFELPRGAITFDIPPDIAVVTSLGAAHIERHGSMEGVAEVKSKIFLGMSPGSFAILNRDMPFYEIFERRATEARLNIITFGTHSEADIRMEELGNGGMFTVNGRSYVLECPCPTEQLYDALATVGVSLVTGYSLKATLERLKSYKPIGGRGNVIELVRGGKKLRLINSTFNANVGSMSGDLKYLRTLEPDAEHRVAVLGDIAELADESEARHRELAPAVLESGADRVLLCGEYMKYLWEELGDKVKGAWFPTREELMDNIDEWLLDGDTVLVKSSHATHLVEVVQYLQKLPRAELEKVKLLQLELNIEDYLPEGITSADVGNMPKERMRQVTGGGLMYEDAARAFEAMRAAAAADGVTLRVNGPTDAYRSLRYQEWAFKARFSPIGLNNPVREGAIQVEYKNKIWQLNKGQGFAQLPNQSAKCYGLGIGIANAGAAKVKEWLKAHASEFGFIQELNFYVQNYVYIRAREGLPTRVLEYERSSSPIDSV